MLYADFLREKYTNTIQTGEVEGVPPLNLPRSKGKALKDYRIYGDSFQTHSLPNKYQEVEYIESTGTQHIDTGVKATNTTGMSATLSKLPNVADGNILGCRLYGSSRFAINVTGNFLGCCFNTYDKTQISATPLADVRTIKLNYLNNREFSASNSTNIFNITSALTMTLPNIYFFGQHLSNGGVNYYPYRVHNVKISEGTTIIRDFIPCYRKSDNEIGMYDLVEGKFYTNSGTGTFTKGADVVPPPEKPIEIESVGDKTKNLFNIKSLTSGQIDSIDYETGVITTHTYYNEVNQTLKQLCPDMVAGKTYILSLTTTGDSPFIHVFGGAEGDRNWRTGTTRTISQSDLDNNIAIYGKWDSSDIVTISNIQIEEGTMATQYDHYGYKIPVAATNGTDTFTTNIYLNEPLRRLSLPSEYQEVEYIESSGTQYIDTGFKPNQNTSMSINALIKTRQQFANVFGGSRNSSRTTSFAILTYEGVFQSSYGTRNNVRSAKTYYANEEYETKLDKNLYYVDGTLLTTHDSQVFQSDYNIYLFGWNSGGNLDTAQSLKGNIYSAKIWDNGSLIRNFIPCYRKSDNVIGMYDLVEGKFYTNDGTGTFLKGADVSDADYLDYKNQKVYRYINVLDVTGEKTIPESYELRAIPVEESITLPQVLTTAPTCILSVGTNVQPSKVYAKYIK